MNINGIYNYYEQMVCSEIMKVMENPDQPLSSDDFEDIACIALNQLPARYVRHGVDVAYYLANEEMASICLAVADAVKSAVVKVKAGSQHLG